MFIKIKSNLDYSVDPFSLQQIAFTRAFVLSPSEPLSFLQTGVPFFMLARLPLFPPSTVQPPLLLPQLDLSQTLFFTSIL